MSQASEFSIQMKEFNEQIFNALVEKIEILTPAHFVFELKCGMKVDNGNYIFGREFKYSRFYFPLDFMN